MGEDLLHRGRDVGGDEMKKRGRRGKKKKEKKNLRKPAIDIHLSLPETLISLDCTPFKFSSRGLTKLFAVTGQWKFYFNFVLMKITSLPVDGLSISPVIWRRREQVTRTTGQLNRCLLSKGRNRSFTRRTNTSVQTLFVSVFLV